MASALRLLIRADGDSDIGTGHVMRMLALAMRVRLAGGHATFASVSMAPALAGRLRREGFDLEHRALPAGSMDDAAWLAELSVRADSHWIAIDGYSFGAAYQESLRFTSRKILAVDDFGTLEFYHADLVLNQNVFAATPMYSRRRKGSRVLLGPAYALLRPEFAAAAALPRTCPDHARSVLVTLGGADPQRVTERVTAALLQISDPNLHIVVVLGPVSGGRRERLVGIADSRVAVREGVEDMTSLMQDAELAVTGAGTTVYELCAMSVPTVVLPIVEAQRDVAAKLAAAGLCHHLGDDTHPDAAARAVGDLLTDRSRRQALGLKGRAAVDGRGAERVLEALSR
jgi:UDP-2,4-diacetamido-2,4,6-trideoxy-beta-L-altropyranose hydrolase